MDSLVTDLAVFVKAFSIYFAQFFDVLARRQKNCKQENIHVF